MQAALLLGAKAHHVGGELVGVLEQRHARWHVGLAVRLAHPRVINAVDEETDTRPVGLSGEAVADGERAEEARAPDAADGEGAPVLGDVPTILQRPHERPILLILVHQVVAPHVEPSDRIPSLRGDRDGLRWSIGLVRALQRAAHNVGLEPFAALQYRPLIAPSDTRSPVCIARYAAVPRRVEMAHCLPSEKR